MQDSKILVIEDETDIRELIFLQLQLKNYTVFTASSGKEAQELIEERDFDF